MTPAIFTNHPSAGFISGNVLHTRNLFGADMAHAYIMRRRAYREWVLETHTLVMHTFACHTPHGIRYTGLSAGVFSAQGTGRIVPAYKINFRPRNHGTVQPSMIKMLLDRICSEFE